ncbi:MAG TPA: DUF3300 domain-containing protein [Humisphaera sp.]|jgi:hypothetical protein|nr:DUF3300 domain-containing protein [Humisphaera sp.]
MFNLWRSIRAGGVCFAALAVAALPAASAQAQTASASAQTKPAVPDKPPLKQEELDQIVAPIALYPDPVLSQVLMASTYPVEIIQADRFAKEYKDLKGAQLTAALEKKDWDPSTKSLVNFPSVLAMMSEKLDWTIKLGDAFIGQQADVMNTVQQLRAKAKAQGNLQTNEQQKVIVESYTATQPAVAAEQVTPAPAQVIRIESASPQVVYVPTYNPTVVYGTWPYPSYPPAYYYPPGYVAGTAALSFGVGLAVGAAWGYAWGGCNWGGNDVDIDVNRNTNINTNIDRDKYKANMDNRQGDRQTNRDGRQTNRQSGQGKFQHDPAHRNGVPYASNRDAQKFGGQSAQQAASARDSYRGRASAGQQDISRNGAGNYRNQVSAADRAGAGNAGNRPGTGVDNRATAGAQNRAGSGGSGATAGNRSTAGANRSSGSGALSGASSNGNSTRAASQRGQTSRSTSSAPRSAPAGRSGGGGRAGGGRR